MKQRNIYLLIFICCMSLIAAANGNANKCKVVAPCTEKLEQTDVKAEASVKEELKFNFSPLEVFTLSI
jgi:hypothetical protein